MAEFFEARYARYNLLEQVALGNVDAVEALGLPPPGPELDSLWQYVPPGADLMKQVLVDAGCTVDPEPNTNNGRWTITEDYEGEQEETAGPLIWTWIVHQAYNTARFNPGVLAEMQNLPVQALQLLYDLEIYGDITDEQASQIREIGGGNYRGHPFTSARWSTTLEDYDSASEVDTISDSDDDDVYVPRELREENERPMPAVYRDRVEIPPPTYEELLEWDATH